MSSGDPARPVTLADVAAAGRVHVSTVSRALRNDPRLTHATRQRLKALAHTLQYRPNPFVTAFNAQVRNYRHAPQNAAIAVLNTTSGDQGQQAWNVRYQRGIESRAADLGFAIDILRLESCDGGQIERLSEVVRTRGLRGLLVLPVHGQTSLASFDFGHLAAATIDVSLRHPALHRASPDYFHGMQRALDALRARRRRRIGFCTFSGEVRRIGAHWMGAFLGWQSESPDDERVVPHVSRFDERETGDGESKRWASHRAAFANWIAAEKPDAIVSNDLFFLDWLRELGHSVPDSVAYASLSIEPGDPCLAGIDQMAERVGAAAVDLVVEQINRNEYGLPLYPKTVLVPGVWVDGGTVG